MFEILIIIALLLIIAILVYIGKKADDLYTKIWHIEYFAREADKRSKPQVINIETGELKIKPQLNPHANPFSELKITIRKEGEKKYSGDVVTSDGKFKSPLKAGNKDSLEKQINGFIKAIIKD